METETNPENWNTELKLQVKVDNFGKQKQNRNFEINVKLKLKNISKQMELVQERRQSHSDDRHAGWHCSRPHSPYHDSGGRIIMGHILV